MIELEVSTPDSIDVDVGTVQETTTDNYEALKNKPTLNGDTFIGAMVEKDPTVPTWAKESEPIEITYTDIKSVWDSIFV